VIGVSLAPRLDPYVRRLRDEIMDANPRTERSHHDPVQKKNCLSARAIHARRWRSICVLFQRFVISNKHLRSILLFYVTLILIPLLSSLVHFSVVFITLLHYASSDGFGIFFRLDRREFCFFFRMNLFCFCIDPKQDLLGSK